jgi:ABC-2 type transport system permease protein
MTVVLGAMAALAAMTAVALVAGGLDVSGSLVLGLGWAGCGLVFAATAAAAAQLSTTSRGANIIAVAAITVAYLARAVGDAVGGPWRWLTWCSPYGWSQQMRPYAGDRLWPLALLLGATAAVTAWALVTQSRRDLGAGLLTEREGRPRAAKSLNSPMALTWRLHRASAWTWLGGFIFFGALFGAMTLSVKGFLSSKAAEEFIKRLGGLNGVTDAFLVVEMRYGAIIAAAFAIQAVLRLHTAELEGHAEYVLAGSTSRVRWATADGAMAFVGSAILVTALGAAAGAAYALSAHRAGEFARLTVAGLALIPVVWFLGAVALLIVAVAPRVSTLAWAVLGAVVVLDEVGPLLRLNHWILDLSPFAHAPNLPGGTVHWWSLAIVMALDVAVAATALVALRRRDLDVR